MSVKLADLDGSKSRLSVVLHSASISSIHPSTIHSPAIFIIALCNTYVNGCSRRKQTGCGVPGGQKRTEAACEKDLARDHSDEGDHIMAFGYYSTF
jgi:hypothetical protein